MNKLKFTGIIILFMGIGFTTAAEKKIVYLSSNSQDINPGTKEKPLASLTGARDFIRDLDTEDTVHVKIAPGDYYLTSPLELSSKDAAPIIFEGIGENVTFYGGFSFCKFTSLKNSNNCQHEAKT